MRTRHPASEIDPHQRGNITITRIVVVGVGHQLTRETLDAVCADVVVVHVDVREPALTTQQRASYVSGTLIAHAVEAKGHTGESVIHTKRVGDVLGTVRADVILADVE